MSSSMFNNNSIQISISDEDSDELGRMRVRVRRKRKKQAQRVKAELTRRVFRFFIKYWTVLIFLFAAGLLLFEATRIGRKPSPVDSSELGGAVKRPHVVENSGLGELRKPISEKKLDGNLNRLDPVTKVVHGVRKCD